MNVSKKRVVLSLGILLLVGTGLIGCRNFLAGRVTADVRWGAMECVRKLKASGALPGFTSNEIGDFYMGAEKIILGVGVKYPLRVTIYASKKSEDSVYYYYELSKETEDKEWKLMKAWQDKGGGTVDLPLQGTGIVQGIHGQAPN